MRTLTAIFTLASFTLAPGASQAQSSARDYTAAQIEQRAVTLCQRAMNARDGAELFAIEAVIDNSMQTWNRKLQAAKSEYEKRRDTLRNFTGPRDAAENELLLHTETGGTAYDPVGVSLMSKYLYYSGMLRSEETQVSKLRHAYTTAVAAAYANAEVLKFVSECVALRRIGAQAPQVAGAPAPVVPQGPPPAAAGDVVMCATTQGPFRCTGQFPATWTLTCSRAAANDGGPAMLLLYPDGTAQAQFTSRIPGNRIDPVAGRISPSGDVLIERRDDVGGLYRWQGRFTLQAPAPGVVRPAGGATMSYRGGPMSCDGQFTLR